MGKERSWSSLLLLLFSLICSAATNKKQHKQSLIASFGTAIFPVQGNVYPDGLIKVTLDIGDPPMPYYLDVDTGSDLAWLQCDAPCVHCFQGAHPLYKPKKNKLVPCKDPLCTAIPTLTRHPCSSPSEQCDYEIAYADHSSSFGVLVKDKFTIRFTNGSVFQPNLAFGCGYDQGGPSGHSPSAIDGVLSLGYGKSSIISQLQDSGLARNVVGHCFSGRGGGYLFFGDALVPNSGVTWTRRDPTLGHYSPGSANLFLGKQRIGPKNLPAVFDSGSSYTYFASQAYQAFINSVKTDLRGKPLKEATEDKTLPLCWKGKRKFESVLDVKDFFKPLVLVFANGNKAQLEIPPAGYLIISSEGNVCLGILNGTENGLGKKIVIGDISLLDRMIIYDNEQRRIGWVGSDCNRLPNADVDGDGFSDSFTQHYAASMGIVNDDCS